MGVQLRDRKHDKACVGMPRDPIVTASGGNQSDRHDRESRVLKAGESSLETSNVSTIDNTNVNIRGRRAGVCPLCVRVKRTGETILDARLSKTSECQRMRFFIVFGPLNAQILSIQHFRVAFTSEIFFLFI